MVKDISQPEAFKPDAPADAWRVLLQLLSPFVQALPNTIDDVALIKLANEQAVLFALVEQLQAKNALGAFAPLTLEYFTELYNQQCLRQKQALQQIASITKSLNEQGITPLYFKGVAFLLAGWNKTDASRFFIDIDILLGEQDAAKAQNILQQEGYQPTNTQPLRHHHLPSLQHKQLPLSVEIHIQPLPARAGFILPAKTMQKNSQEVLCERFGRYQLASANDSFTVLAANAELANLGVLTGAINLKDALDVLALLKFIDVASLPNDDKAYVYAVMQLFNAAEQKLEGLPKALGEKRLAQFYKFLHKGFNPTRLLLAKIKQRFSTPCLQRKYGCRYLFLRPDVYAREVLALLLRYLGWHIKSSVD